MSTSPNPAASTPEAPSASRLAGINLLPTEDRAAFAEFYAQVVAEFEPQGIIEEGYVSLIARLMWRLTHLDIFRKAKKAHEEYGPFVRKGSFNATLQVYVIYQLLAAKELLDENIKRKSMTWEEAAAYLRKERERVVGSEAAKALEAIGKDDDPRLVLNSKPDEDLKNLNNWLDNTMGYPEAEKMRAEINKEMKNGSDLQLAHLADMITVDNYLASLELAESIRKEIDECFRSFWQIRKEKRKNKERSKHRSRLLPPY